MFHNKNQSVFVNGLRLAIILLMQGVDTQDRVETHYAPSGECFQYMADDTAFPQRTFTAARAHCQAAGADLVVINDQVENNIIDHHVFPGAYFEFWLGLTLEGGDWVWWDNSSGTFRDFTTDPAKNEAGAECTVVGPDSGWAGGIWRQTVCTPFNRDTVCELACNDTTPVPGFDTTTVEPRTTTTTVTTTTTAPPTTTTSTSTSSTTSTSTTTPTTTTTATPTTESATTSSRRASTTSEGMSQTSEGDCMCNCPTLYTPAVILPLVNFTYFPLEEINWSVWLPWSSCTQTCGGGVQVRWRLCNALNDICDRSIEPPTGVNVHHCVSGYSLDGRECGSEPCPTFGVWFTWTAWSECSATCGAGTRGRYRVCVKPEPESATCEGRNTTYERCTLGDCPDSYTPIIAEEVDGGVMYKESDRRASAQAVGTMGIVFLAVAGGLLLFCDIFHVKPSHGAAPKPRGPPPR